MKFILVSPKNRTSYNFRGDLIKRIISQGYEVVVTGPNRDNVDKIEELGARFVEIPMNKNGVNPLHDIKYLLTLKKLFKAEKPDVTLGYTSKPVIYGCTFDFQSKYGVVLPIFNQNPLQRYCFFLITQNLFH